MLKSTSGTAMSLRALIKRVPKGAIKSAVN
jgi:hypothetical protein